MGSEIDKGSWMKNFESHRPDLLFPESWSEATKGEAIDELRPTHIKTAIFTSIPMKCYGESCPFSDTCPLFQRDIAPEGDPCPLEMAMVVQFTQDYIEELGIDPESLVEVSAVRDLVDQEIQYMRKSKTLAKDHFIQENVIGIDDNGRPILKKELHLAVELEDKLHRRKKDLRTQLLATREAKAKVGRGELDTAQVVSKVLTQITEMDRQKEQLIKRKLGIGDKDDYIDADIEMAEIESRKDSDDGS